MAVNSHSEPDVLNFYSQTVNMLPWQIKANEAHTLMLNQIARECPAVRLVDTQPGLDGRYTNFTDLVHFTQDGRDKVAEAFFQGIKETLVQAIGTSL